MAVNVLILFMYITRLASNEIFSPSNKIHREVGRANDLSAPLCLLSSLFLMIRELTALLMRTQKVLETLVYSQFNYLTPLLTRENFTEFNSRKLQIIYEALNYNLPK